MAKTPEIVQWENGIYQIETSDLVQGGLGGIDNEPHRLLANRTAFLKDRIDSVALQAGITPDVTQKQIIQAAVLHVATLASVRAIPVPDIPNAQTVTVFARGLNADGDGAGGQYRWVYNSSATDDGDSVLKPSTNPTLGRWIKIKTATGVQALQLASGNNSSVAIELTTGFLDVTPVGGNATIVSFAPSFDGHTVVVTNVHASLRATIATSAARLPDNIVLLARTAQSIKFSKTLGWVGV